MVTPVQAHEVHVIAARLRHSRWVTEECPNCDYKIGYLFDGDKVTYDPGCRCEGCTANMPVQSSWFTVAADVNARLLTNDSQEVIKYWGLDNDTRNNK